MVDSKMDPILKCYNSIPEMRMMIIIIIVNKISDLRVVFVNKSHFTEHSHDYLTSITQLVTSNLAGL